MVSFNDFILKINSVKIFSEEVKQYKCRSNKVLVTVIKFVESLLVEF